MEEINLQPEQQPAQSTDQQLPTRAQSFLSKLNWVYINSGLVLFLIIGLGFIWFTKNKKNSHQTPSIPTSQNANTTINTRAPSPIVLITESLALTDNKSPRGELIVIERNLYRILPSGEKKLLISDNNREVGGFIFNLIEEVFSPDNLKSIVLINEGIEANSLYYLSQNDTEAIFVDVVSNAIWSNNSRYIAYTVSQAGVGPKSIFVFNTETQEKWVIGQSKLADGSGSIDYSKLEWIDNDNAIKANYTKFIYSENIPWIEVYDKAKIEKGETVLPLK